MSNLDTKYGTYNKQTKIFSQIDQEFSTKDGFFPRTVFANVDEAKTYFFTTEALSIWNDCCTNLQWALVADENSSNTKLKVTFDFGTKGSGISAADDWAGQYNSRKQALLDAGESNWFKQGSIESSTDHLF